MPLSLDKGPIYAIGDVHGCLEALLGLQALIQEDAKSLSGRPQIVLLGDMIDRGPAVGQLIDHLQAPLSWADRSCIMGNHEAMMLDFLQNPAANLDWLSHGGFETLRSYGLALDRDMIRSTPRRRIDQMLAAYLPQDHINWLRALPYGYYTKTAQQTWVYAHASFDPAKELSNQPKDDLLWGHNFLNHVQSKDLRLVYGHVIQPYINTENHWIGIDSGAYKTGRLTALRLTQDLRPKIIHFN